MSTSDGNARGKVTRVVTQRLEALQLAGVSHLPKARRIQSAATSQPSEQAPSLRGIHERSLFDATFSGQSAVSPELRPAALEVIRGEVAACTRCTELSESRTQTVFGVGSPTAQICFVGEAPGADEDRQGEPFVGRAGQLLTKMIQACGLKREDVYILNVLKCRPPQNRTPLPDEVANCRGYFERQLQIIRPAIVCCLGAVAAQAVLSTDRSIGKLRGQFHEYRDLPVICTYHPAYLLRNPAAKSDAWQDLKMMMRRLGIELQ